MSNDSLKVTGVSKPSF